jgi:hypothetical protein
MKILTPGIFLKRIKEKYTKIKKDLSSIREILGNDPCFKGQQK